MCFGVGRVVSQPFAVLNTTELPPALAQALSNTLPFLRCGEESAVHAFGRRLVGVSAGAEQGALQGIADDEARHAAWLEALALALPAPDAVPATDAMASFFRRLLTRDAALHFARIAALDLAVCALLAPLASRRSVLARAPEVVAGLGAICRDEARHVRVARDCAGRLGVTAQRQHALDLALRRELGVLLSPVRASMALLGIDGA